nr:MAG TPA: hypothetical protein [Caudoviricetes sp.]
MPGAASWFRSFACLLLVCPHQFLHLHAVVLRDGFCVSREWVRNPVPPVLYGRLRNSDLLCKTVVCFAAFGLQTHKVFFQSHFFTSKFDYFLDKLEQWCYSKFATTFD